MKLSLDGYIYSEHIYLAKFFSPKVDKFLKVFAKRFFVKMYRQFFSAR